MEQAALGSFCSLVIGQQLFFLTCHNIADSQCASLSRPQACSVSGVGGQNIDQQGLAGSLCNSLGLAYYEEGSGNEASDSGTDAEAGTDAETGTGTDAE